MEPRKSFLLKQGYMWELGLRDSPRHRPAAEAAQGKEPCAGGGSGGTRIHEHTHGVR